MTEPNNYHEIIKLLWNELSEKDAMFFNIRKEVVDEDKLYTKIKFDNCREKLSKTSYDLLEDILIK